LCGRTDLPTTSAFLRAKSQARNVAREIFAAEGGSITVDKLEAMTAVCSVGLDMIALPGDTPAETIAAIIAVTPPRQLPGQQKPLGSKPIPGRKAHGRSRISSARRKPAIFDAVSRLVPPPRTPGIAGERRLDACQPSQHGRRGSAGSLPQFTEIFFHKNVTDSFTSAPAHHPLRPSLDVGIKQRSRGKNELHALSFIVAVWPRKIQEIFARHHPLIRVE
jgi:hypothetical protein